MHCKSIFEEAERELLAIFRNFIDFKWEIMTSTTWVVILSLTFIDTLMGYTMKYFACKLPAVENAIQHEILFTDQTRKYSCKLYFDWCC